MEYRIVRVNMEDVEASRQTRLCGQLWNEVLSVFNKNRIENRYLTEGEMKSHFKGFNGLHSQTTQAVIERFYSARKTAFVVRKQNPKMKFPHKRKSESPAVWKRQGISIKDGNLNMSLGKKYSFISIPWNRNETPTEVKICRDKITGKQFALCAIQFPDTELSTSDKTLGVDLGEKVLAVLSNGEQQFMLSSKLIRSKIRYRHKTLGSIATKQKTKKKNSRSWRKLQARKDRMRIKIERQLEHILHSQSKNLVEITVKLNIGKVTFGDLATLRNNKKGQSVNNNFLYGNFRRKCVYKLLSKGIASEKISEAYTSQTCPCCLTRNNLTDPQSRKALRIYRCANCGFIAHRDCVGSINMWKKTINKFEVSCPTARSRWMNPPVSVKPKCSPQKNCVIVKSMVRGL